MRNTLWIAAAGLVFAHSALGTPPTDEQIAQAISRYETESKAGKSKAEAAKEAFTGLDFTEASLEQLTRVSQAGLFTLLEEHGTIIRARLTALGEAPGIDGVKALNLLAGAVSAQRPKTADDWSARQAETARVVAKALRNPEFVGAAKSGEAESIVSAFGSLAASGVKEHNLLPAVEQLLSSDLPPMATLRVCALFDSVTDDEAGFDRATIEHTRAAMYNATTRALDAFRKDLASAEETLAQIPPGEKGVNESPERTAAVQKRDTADRMVKYAERMATYLNGAFARGQLVGHEAPNIQFTWSTLGESTRSLRDLKGKVVVLDFWATWCGPCLASFPNIRELQARYKDYPVVILGVTSLQGFHMKRKAEDWRKSERIDTKNDPAREHALMADFIKDMDMTWAVAFGEPDVFNPEYGVRGIPHVAIIDPAGVVRHRGLHPGGDPAEEAEKIDALLREFGFKTPPEPMTPKSQKGD